MENSLLAIFDEIPCTIVQGLLSNFEATSSIHLYMYVGTNGGHCYYIGS